MAAINDSKFAVQLCFAKTNMVHLLDLLPLWISEAGTFQRVAGDLLNVSPSSIFHAIGRFPDRIAEELYTELIKFPSLFLRLLDFPDCRAHTKRAPPQTKFQ